jgi:tetratricopeptide (TPR) repeat protein
MAPKTDIINEPPSSESFSGETFESNLQELVSDYRAAIERLPNRAERSCERDVLTVLLARQHIAKAIGKGTHKASDLFTEIGDLDEQLKAKARVVISCTGAKTFQNWRDLFQPPESGWWWFLDKRVNDAERARTVVWVLLTGFAVTLIISVAADISSRFLVGVPDRLSILSTAVQVFLALLAGSSFTQAGREWVSGLLAAVHVRAGLQPFFGFVLALVVLSAVIGFRYCLPAVARSYNQRGAQALRDNKVGAALADFQRAVSLNPDYPEAQYNLAYAQETVFDYDKAIASYQKTIELSPNFDEAYNNLAHLYLLYRSDYKRALDILSQIFSKQITDQSLKYAAYKNRAWAFMGQDQLALSENDLRLAQSIQDTAEIHCMRGEVLWRMSSKKGAVDEWNMCLEKAKTDSNGVEPYWQALAMTGIRKE